MGHLISTWATLYQHELSLGSISRDNNQQFHYNHVGGWRGVVSYWGYRIIGHYYSRDRKHLHVDYVPSILAASREGKECIFGYLEVVLDETPPTQWM